jgi:hypothetical protein
MSGVRSPDFTVAAYFQPRPSDPIDTLNFSSRQLIRFATDFERHEGQWGASSLCLSSCAAYSAPVDIFAARVVHGALIALASLSSVLSPQDSGDENQ